MYQKRPFRDTASGGTSGTGLSAASCSETRPEIYNPLPATFDGFGDTPTPTPRHMEARCTGGGVPPLYDFDQRA